MKQISGSGKKLALTLSSVQEASSEPVYRRGVQYYRRKKVLKYSEDEDQAPSIVAQGQGELAKQIVEAARAYGVPIVRDVPVARALNELEVGDEIPEALYEAVATLRANTAGRTPEDVAAEVASALAVGRPGPGAAP